MKRCGSARRHQLGGSASLYRGEFHADAIVGENRLAVGLCLQTPTKPRKRRDEGPNPGLVRGVLASCKATRLASWHLARCSRAVLASWSQSSCHDLLWLPEQQGCDRFVRRSAGPMIEHPTNLEASLELGQIPFRESPEHVTAMFFASRPRIPDSHGAIVGPGSESLAVRAGSDAKDQAGVATKGELLLARFQVPDHDGRVGPARGEPAAIGAKC